MNMIEILYVDGCRNAEIATDLVRQVLASTGISADLTLTSVKTYLDAARHRFLGSPTIRVNGQDVDRSARGREDYGLQCRVYSVDGRLAGTPLAAWIEAALRGDPKAYSTDVR